MSAHQDHVYTDGGASWHPAWRPHTDADLAALQHDKEGDRDSHQVADDSNHVHDHDQDQDHDHDHDHDHTNHDTNHDIRHDHSRSVISSASDKTFLPESKPAIELDLDDEDFFDQASGQPLVQDATTHVDHEATPAESLNKDHLSGTTDGQSLDIEDQPTVGHEPNHFVQTQPPALEHAIPSEDVDTEALATAEAEIQPDAGVDADTQPEAEAEAEAHAAAEVDAEPAEAAEAGGESQSPAQSELDAALQDRQESEDTSEPLASESLGHAEYEHQSGINAADDAIGESVNAPLLEDEAALPTSAEVGITPAAEASSAWPGDEADDVFETIGAKHNDAFETSDEQNTLQDETSAFFDQDHNAQQTDMPNETSQAFNWGDEEADNTFDALATEQPTEDVVWDRAAQANAAGGEPVAASKATAVAQVMHEMKEQEAQREEADPAAVESTNAQEDDITALWKAALDDDEFLDDANEADGLDPSAFFDDGEGFLDDFGDVDAQKLDQMSPTQLVPATDARGNIQGFTTLADASAANKYASEATQRQTLSTVASPQTLNTAQVPAVASASSMYNVYGQPAYASAPPAQTTERPAAKTAMSFVDKSKGGYSSPYDLPEDIVKTRRRPVQTNAAVVSQPTPPAPPRTSSMQSFPPPPPLSRAGTAVSAVSMSPQIPTSLSPSLQPKQSPIPGSGASKSGDAGFFADLPVVAKPRGRQSSAYTPVPSTAPLQAPPVGPPQGPPSRPPSRPVMPPSASLNAPVYAGLRQPERLPLLPDGPEEGSRQAQQLQPPQPPVPPPSSRYSPSLPASTAPAAPPASARFSPMPPSAPPAATSRYSPAPQSVPNQTQSRYAEPPAGQLSPKPAQPFAPRASSPLAYQKRPAHEQAGAPPQVRAVSYQPSHASPDLTRHLSGPPHVPVAPGRRQSEQIDQSPTQLPHNAGPAAPPRANSYTPSAYAASAYAPSAYAPSAHIPSASASPESRRSQPYTPVEARPHESLMMSPQRSRTQSPGAVMKMPLRAMTQIERPSSAAGAMTSPTATVQRQDTRQKLHPARRQFSADLSYSVPLDERAADSLERWKGYPVFNWNPSGALVSSFPKQAPFYAAGHAIPTIKCTPGSITIHDSRLDFPMDERDAKFPGPFSLKGKSKKKDVLAWISGKIEDLERAHESTLLDFGIAPLQKKRTEEKVILWKMVRLLLENDNKIEGSTPAEESARKILLPELSQEPTEISNGATVELNAEPVDLKALTNIKRHLLEGQREKAVWYAAEHKLWSHALLIASVAGPEIWKQVVQEFVRAQVKDAGENAQSLAALYEVFAGNWEESIDELVPPSARAGFQMVSKNASMSAGGRNPLDGLDQWRETLGLIISNRSPNDVQAIAALGKLLSKYGRVEAAHTCFLFARASAVHGGADDINSDFVLLGADHQNQPHELFVDLDSIMLTEVYEYGLSLAPAAGTSPVIPHLQAYKLHHANVLAEHGLRNEAQAYCDAIAAAVKSTTRGSPYYHPAFSHAVDELSRCLSQAPQSSSGSSWISKPSMDKVSGSMWKRFNTFVAGDDDDTASQGSGAGGEHNAAGPFGRITGDTPAVSRSASSVDLYGAMANGGVPMMGSSAPSKYAPVHAAAPRAPPEPASSGRYAPMGSPYAPGRSSLESSRSSVPEPDRPGTAYSMYTGLQPPVQPPMQRANSTPFGAYLPQPDAATGQAPMQHLAPGRPEPARAVSEGRYAFSQPPTRRESVQSASAYEPQFAMEQTQQSFGYQPHSADSPYQPRSYTPSVPGYGAGAIEEEASEQTQSYDPPQTYQPPDAASSYGAPQSYQPSEDTPSYDPPQSYQPPDTTPSYEPPQSYQPPDETPSYDPPNSHEQTTSYEPTSSYEPTPSYEPAASPYAPPTNSFGPPTSSFDDGPRGVHAPPTSSYAPPGDNSTYVPYEPEFDPEASTDDIPAPPKKKGIMDLSDDDEDIVARAAALKSSQKSEADRIAEENFRKAAEADAERDRQEKEQKKGGGWLTGWFKGGKQQDLGQGGGSGGGGGAGNKPIRAKLGEQNSFYYDPDLKKWVNKKGGSTPEASAPTPPPPRGPSRAPSGTGGPPGGGPPPSGGASPALGGPPPMGMSGPPGSRPPTVPPQGGPPSRSATPGTPSNGAPPVASAVPPGLASRPPSRPLSSASSIDDLLGAPAPRKSGAGAGGKAKKRGGRYVDVMAK